MRELEDEQLTERLEEAEDEIRRLEHLLQEHDKKAKVTLINIFYLPLTCSFSKFMGMTVLVAPAHEQSDLSSHYGVCLLACLFIYRQ